MRKVLILTVAALLVIGAGTSYGEIPRQRDPVIPGEDFLNYPASVQIKLAQAGYKFLSYPVGARPAALAGAYGTTTGDATSVFYNAAGLAFLKAGSGEAFGGYSQWLADIKYSWGGFAYNINGVNAFGFGLLTVDNGTIQGTKVNTKATDDYELTSTFQLKEYAAMAAYARKITDRFSIGLAFKVAHQDLGKGQVLDTFGKPATITNVGTTWAMDLGTYFNTGFRSVAIGVNVNNYGRSLDFQGAAFQLPRRVAMAFSFDLLTLANRPKESHKAMIRVDVEKPNDFTERALVGAEYLFDSPKAPVGLRLRGGYRFNHDTESFSGGGGLVFQNKAGRGVTLDYAYKRFNTNFFDAVQIVSGSVLF